MITLNPRPRKPEHEKQDSKIIFGCTSKEKQEIETLAKMHGYIKTADFIRRAALGYEQVDRTKLEGKKKAAK